MSHHIFISFSSRDRDKAEVICKTMERAGLRCWISLRDVGPGENYQAAIVTAIRSAKVFVLVFSANSNDSPEVQKELSLASAFKSTVIPVRIADVRPEGALAYELATRQWIDAFASWDGAMEQLVSTVRRTAEADAAAAPSAPAAPPRDFSKDDLDAARAALAPYLGPIAEMLVRKAAANAGSVADLHERLAAHITRPDEQAAFRQKLKMRA